MAAHQSPVPEQPGITATELPSGRLYGAGQKLISNIVPAVLVTLIAAFTIWVASTLASVSSAQDVMLTKFTEVSKDQEALAKDQRAMILSQKEMVAAFSNAVKEQSGLVSDMNMRVFRLELGKGVKPSLPMLPLVQPKRPIWASHASPPVRFALPAKNASRAEPVLAAPRK